MTQPRIRVEGLRELRQALRAVDTKLPREVGKALKAGAKIAADRAQQTVRHGATGDLADSVKPGATGVRGYVRSRLIYAGVHEYGGRVGINRSVRITPTKAINRSVDDALPQVAEKISDEIDQLTRRHGF